MLKDLLSTPLPRHLKKRPRDSRGFPVPFMNAQFPDGRPDFTAIDARKVRLCAERRLCGLCGLPVKKDEVLAFVGGPMCHENGVYSDPGAHQACARYALRVCPHMAIQGAMRSRFLQDGSYHSPFGVGEKPECWKVSFALQYRYDGLHFLVEQVRWSETYRYLEGRLERADD